ncbi:hypothetical protein SF293071_3039 [Shigella flexneri 2930-71]|nr:hypothetical protein SF2457T_0613 [Shigella flexneri 2a str. 2457T]EGJ96545.1 hypothetical protein SF293071_3039 [Shigella flexneri 2930-71]EJL13539.1 hypothetical protein SF660363_3018 [Shigella flexneri 6603-63]
MRGNQPVDRSLRLIPDIRGWGHRVLELIFVLLQLGLVLLNLLERLRHRLDGRHDVLGQVAAVDDGDTSLHRGGGSGDKAGCECNG